MVYVGEGAVGQGYPVDPDPEVIGFQEMFERYRLSSPGWYLTESDSGPGPANRPRTIAALGQGERAMDARPASGR